MLGLRTTPRDETGFSASKAVYGAPLCLPGEFLDCWSASQWVPGQDSVCPSWFDSASFSSCRSHFSLYSCSSSLCWVHVLSRQDKFFSLEIGSKQDTVSIDRLKSVLGPVLCPQQPPRQGRPPSSTLVSLPMVQDPCPNPLKDIMPRSAPTLRRGSRPPRGRPWSGPPDLSFVPSPTSLLEDVSAHVRRNPRCLVWRILPTRLPLHHHLLVDLGDDAGGEPCDGSECRLPLQLKIYSNCTSNHTVFHVYIIQFTICTFYYQIYIRF